MAPEYVEARLQLPSEKVEEFVSFCQNVLGCMPAIHKLPEDATGPEVLERIDGTDSKASASE